jgi:hypothetical protein
LLRREGAGDASELGSVRFATFADEGRVHSAGMIGSRNFRRPWRIMARLRTGSKRFSSARSVAWRLNERPGSLTVIAPPPSKICSPQWLRDIFQLWREYNSLRYLFVFEEEVFE